MSEACEKSLKCYMDTLGLNPTADFETEIAAAFESGYACGQQSRTPPPATAFLVRCLRDHRNEPYFMVYRAQADKILAEWPEPSEPEGGRDG